MALLSSTIHNIESLLARSVIMILVHMTKIVRCPSRFAILTLLSKNFKVVIKLITKGPVNNCNNMIKVKQKKNHQLIMSYHCQSVVRELNTTFSIENLTNKGKDSISCLLSSHFQSISIYQRCRSNFVRYKLQQALRFTQAVLEASLKKCHEVR